MIQYFQGSESLATAAAAIVAEDLRNQAASGWFSLALAGGDTPIPVYHRLAEVWQNQPLPWLRAMMVPGDERLLAPDDPRRNDQMIREALLQGLPAANAAFLPLLNQWPLTEGEGERAAVVAENRLRAAWFGELTPAGLPRFDLILLGLGTDGHTASLFADSQALAVTDRWVMAVPAPTSATPQVPRLTLTGAVIRAARRVIFIVAGVDKVALAEHILADPQSPVPAARVRAPATCDWLLAR